MIYINNKKSNLIEVDSTLFWGRGVFETIYINNKPIFLKEHIERLNNGAKKLFIQFKICENDVLEFIKTNNIKDCALKITLTEKNVIYSTREVKYKKEQYINGFKIGISNVLRNSTSILPYIKSTCYIENVLEKEKGLVKGFDEVIFLNEKGYITEGATCNLFFVSKGIIYTPKVSCGLLNGVIRKWIIDNFNVCQGEYTLEDLMNSDEVFLTNSLMGIMKVKNIEKRFFEKNECIQIISEKYSKYVNGGE